MTKKDFLEAGIQFGGKVLVGVAMLVIVAALLLGYGALPP